MALKLKPEVKQLWLEGLRSGDYPQCIGKLSNNVGYCCLGVLSEIAHKEGVVSREVEEVADGFHNTTEEVRYGRVSNYLPKEVAEWAFEPYNPVGEYYENPRVNDPRAHDDYLFVSTTSLSELNDEGYDFREIADVIEEQL